MKPIRYRLPISKKFPHYHQLKGMETGFKDAIKNDFSLEPYAIIHFTSFRY